MPVYLCQAGTGSSDPWRHGLQVYAAPFPIDDSRALPPPSSPSGGSVAPRDLAVANWAAAPTSSAAAAASGGNSIAARSTGNGVDTVSLSSGRGQVGSAYQNHHRSHHQQQQPIRRIRHAEVVIVDDICIAYERYWLRLRWPGRKGGFAGYVAQGLVSEMHNRPNEIALPATLKMVGAGELDGAEDLQAADALEDRAGSDEAELDEGSPEEERQETGSMPISEPSESNVCVTCFRTGLPFQTCPSMRLQVGYDDGISPPVSLSPFPTDHVFCRICREGLHEDADDEQPSPAAEDGGDEEGRPDGSSGAMEDEIEEEPAAVDPSDTNAASDAVSKGPVQPHPVYSQNTHAQENPLLAPCECAGSMAFVHYLCVEQWRCRSNHPDARNGLNCETCGTAYALPPPPARPAVNTADQDEFLEAMPPHVIAALRQPHIWWQMGAAIVRRRWLRPIAPVLMSPVVALYCRARRLLKKRGVARRRWACSLCRRRARWKCVRCLRSYYCSRQCQNVSWHIVHKHVCYKPSRFWWSVVVYGAAGLAMFPGVLRDPLMYDLGLCLIPVSFVVIGILGGAFATALKKTVGFDLRGRMLELAVVLWTIWLTVVSWGLVKGFFGSTDACHGAIGSVNVTADNVPFTLRATRSVLLSNAESYYLFWDRVAMKSPAWLRSGLCMNVDGWPGCFEHVPSANANFFLQEEGGESCAGDLYMVVWLYISAGFAYVGSAYWKHVERQRRRRGVRQRAGRGEARPHQD